MSCFMVSNETINRVVHLLALDSCCELRCMPEGWHEPIGHELQRLNAQAMHDRYEGRHDEPYQQYVWWPCWRYSLIDLLKAGQCWIYQASDADEADDSALYQQVRDACRKVAEHIVAGLDEYKASPWGAPERQACCGDVVEFVPTN